MRIIADTSFLYATFNNKDVYHQAATAFTASAEPSQILVPDVVMPEAAFVFTRDFG